MRPAIIKTSRQENKKSNNNKYLRQIRNVYFFLEKSTQSTLWKKSQEKLIN